MGASQTALKNQDSTDSESSEDFEVPAVVAVVVAKDPGPWFADMLHSLADQDYENMSVLVIDAGSEEPIASRVAASLPEAYIHRLTGDPGWSVGANQALELVSGSPFLLFCHDDVVLERSCVSALMDELYKSNAGIVGPKLVEWDDPRKLLQVGMGADRFGVQVDQIDRGEFDQQQYDSARDMFFIPGGVQLIRADLLQAVGGFDEGISYMGEDLDVCWRAHAVGARVRVVPTAKAKHIESADQRVLVSQRRRMRTRHRLRSLLTNSTLSSRFTTVPMAIMLILFEAFYALFSGRRRQAGDLFSALLWNLSSIGSVRPRRNQLSKIRKVSDRQIRKKQVGGSAQLSEFWRNKFEAGQTRLDSVLSSSQLKVDSSSSVHSLFIFLIVMGILIIGSRGILTQSYQVFGEIPAMRNSLGLVREWFSGFRTAGTGGEANAPLAFLALGSIRGLFFFAPGLFDRLLVFAPLIIGYWGGSRLARPYRSPRLQSISGALYVLNPIVFAMLSAGRWESLVIWAALPYIVTSALKLAGVAPFSNRSGTEDSFFTERTDSVNILRYGFLIMVVSTLAPAVIPIGVLVIACVGFASVYEAKSLRSVVFGAFAAVAVPAVLHFPWSLDVVQNFEWSWLVGSKSSEASDFSLFNLLSFNVSEATGLGVSGQDGGSLFDITSTLLVLSGLVVSAFGLFALVAMKAESTRITVLGWTLAAVGWGLLWAESRELLPFTLPSNEIMLAVVLSGLILSIGAGASQYETAFSKSVSRFRYVSLGVSIAGMVLILLGGLSTVGSGRWGIPESPRRTTAESLFAGIPDEGEVETSGRILWLGDRSVIPVDTYETPDGIPYALTDAAVDVRNKWVPGPVGTTDAVGEYLDLAVVGGTSSLGQLTASYGVDFVIVAEQIARQYTINPADPAISAALERQTDLELDRSGNDAFTIYQNTRSSGFGAAFGNSADADARSVTDQLQVDLASQPISVLPRIGRPGSWTVEIPADTSVYIAVPVSGFSLDGVDNEIIQGFDGHINIAAGSGGLAELDHSSLLPRGIFILMQLVLLASAISVAQTRVSSET